MDYFSGHITEIKINGLGQKQALINSPKKFIPSPGQYIQAYAPSDIDTPLPISLFPIAIIDDRSFLSAPPIPSHWIPGIELQLRGPLGRGFKLENTTTKIGLIALDDFPDRLLPFAEHALSKNIEVALFSDIVPSNLSTQIEVNPLSIARQAFQWADNIAIDSPSISFEEVLSKIGVSSGENFSCPTQILINIPMPCAGIAKCGICTINGNNKYSLLACEDGPVFSLTKQGFQKSK